MFNYKIAVRRTWFAAVGAPVLMACLSAFVPAAASAQEFMSEEELLATIPGSTIDGKTDKGVEWVQAYSAYDGKHKKGKIAGDFQGQAIKSRWYVEHGQWCEDWGSGNACWQVEKIGKKKLRMYQDGHPRPNPWVLR